jgi:MtN3 and saliva related transmembrane protein
MNDQLLNWIGYLAGTLTTIAFVPQLIKIVRTKSARDVSLGMFVLFMVGVLLWLIYGWLRADMVLIAANTVTLALSVAILVCKLWFERKA